MPPFLTREQLPEEEVEETGEIASLRTHVEWRVQQVTNFIVFGRRIPLYQGPAINDMEGWGGGGITDKHSVSHLRAPGGRTPKGSAPNDSTPSVSE